MQALNVEAQIVPQMPTKMKDDEDDKSCFSLTDDDVVGQNRPRRRRCSLSTAMAAAFLGIRPML